MMMITVFLVLAFAAVAQAGCDNACSGHGTCGARGICECYDNWGLGLNKYNGDCSQRICPYEIAWVDRPDGNGYHHKYAECANRGICNRDSGECECFPGYEGKGCQRSSCPSDCSGHGRCIYINEQPYGTVPMDSGLDYFLTQDPVTYDNMDWEANKGRACVCDPGYGDFDCSKRMCPYGTDVMDQRNDMSSSYTARYQMQEIRFARGTSNSNDFGSETSSTFALTFKSKLNETYTTIPIVFDPVDGTSDLALDIKYALQSLPNKVIDEVNVYVTTTQLGSYPVDTTAITFPSTDSSYTDGVNVYVYVEFVGDSVQGPQNLLTVRAYECQDGCTPKISGLLLNGGTQTVTEVTYTNTAGDIDESFSTNFNSYECGRRGKCDYATGICTCFAGYTGINCNVITTLV